MNGKLFILGEENFPIIVDYNLPLANAWGMAIKAVVEWGGVELKDRIFFHFERREFQFYYATLQKDMRSCDLEEKFREYLIIPADMIQLFAFIQEHVKTEVTAKKPDPIVAAALGSTWRCSHDILLEMAGVRWSSWYHNQGPSFGTISENPHKGIEKGTRFLAVRQ